LTPAPGKRRTPTRPGRLALLVLVGGLALGGAACKQKEAPPRLTQAECDTFCARLVPCFRKKLAEFSRTLEQDVTECVKDCRGKAGQEHSQVLRAMKRCGHLTRCDELESCFEKAL
jgi:hypothetical protein